MILDSFEQSCLRSQCFRLSLRALGPIELAEADSEVDSAFVGGSAETMAHCERAR